MLFWGGLPARYKGDFSPWPSGLRLLQQAQIVFAHTSEGGDIDRPQGRRGCIRHLYSKEEQSARSHFYIYPFLLEVSHEQSRDVTSKRAIY